MSSDEMMLSLEEALAQPLEDDPDAADAVPIGIQRQYQQIYLARLRQAGVDGDVAKSIVNRSLCASCVILAPGGQNVTGRKMSRRPTLEAAARCREDYNDADGCMTSRGLLMDEELFTACLPPSMSEARRAELLQAHNNQRARLQRNILQQRMRVARVMAKGDVKLCQKLAQRRQRRREALFRRVASTVTLVPEAAAAGVPAAAAAAAGVPEATAAAAAAGGVPEAAAAQPSTADEPAATNTTYFGIAELAAIMTVPVYDAAAAAAAHRVIASPASLFLAAAFNTFA